jgi:hypothetical protein
MTAQNAAMTVNRVRIASGFSGGGSCCALALELMMEWSEGCAMDCMEDRRSSCLLVMTRTFFVLVPA